jgi:hypothetical protein
VPANAIDSKDSTCLRQRLYSSGRSPGLAAKFLGIEFITRTSRPELGYARGLSRMEFTTVNIATLPPMPRLKERMAVIVKPRGRAQAPESATQVLNPHRAPPVCVSGNGSSGRQLSYQAGRRFDSKQGTEIGKADVFASGTGKSENGQVPRGIASSCLLDRLRMD